MNIKKTIISGMVRQARHKWLIIFIIIINFTCTGLSTDDLTNGTFLPDASEFPRISVKQDSTNYGMGSIYNFSSQENGTESDSITFTIENSGRQNLKFEGNPKISLTGDDAAMFSITQPGITTIAEGESTTFTVAFTPLKIGGIGDKSAVIEIETNDPLNSKYILSLTGESINIVLAADMGNGALSVSPENLTAIKEKLYFTADDGVHGRELWVYDASKENSRGLTGSTLCSDGDNPCMVADIFSGADDSNPDYLTEYNNKLYFRASNGVLGKELWVYDDTKSVTNGIDDVYGLCAITDSDNPCMVADINPSGGSSSLSGFLTVCNTGFGDKLYFSASNGTNGNELWAYDDSNTTINPGINCASNNPCMVADIRTGGVEDSNPSDLAVYNNNLYFSVYGDGLNGRELWVYDGMSASMVAKIYSATGSSPVNLTVYNNKLYFQAENGSGKELWRYEDSSPLSGTTGGYLLCSTTSDNPCMVQDICSGGGSVPEYLTVYNNKLYFSANNGTDGIELWAHDGTTTSMIADIGLDGDSSPRYLTLFDGKLFFSASNTLNGRELWVYDGSTVTDSDSNGYRECNTGDSPCMFADVNPGSDPSFTPWREGDRKNLITIYNNNLYFSASDSIHGEELWRYNP